MPALCLSAGSTLLDQRQWRLDPGVAGVEVSAAVLATNDCVGDRAAVDVDQVPEELVGGGTPLVTPTPHRHEDVVEIPPLFGQSVLEPGRPVFIEVRGENASLYQHCQALGQDIASDPEVFLEIIEAANSEKGIAQDEDRPTIPDQFCGVSHRTVEMLEALASRNKS